jgi:hypothetical protein
VRRAISALETTGALKFFTRNEHSAFQERQQPNGSPVTLGALGILHIWLHHYTNFEHPIIGCIMKPDWEGRSID